MTENTAEKPDLLTIAEFCAEGGRQVIKRSELLRWVNDRTENRYFEIR